MLVKSFTRRDVERWIEVRYREFPERPLEGVPLRWVGKAAENMGLTGEAKPEAALHVLRDWITPNGELIDGLGSTAAYWVRFHPDSTVEALAADPAKRKAVWKAHGAAVEAAVEALDAEVWLGLIGVEAARCDGMINEIVFLASASHPVLGWEPLDTPTAVINVVLPAVRWAFTTYHQRLGKKLARRLGVEVAYEPSPDDGVLAAVVQS